MTIIKTFDTTDETKILPKKYILFTIFGLLSLVLAEIWVNNTVVAFSDQYEKLAGLEKKLQMENQILENDIAANSSLKIIATKSAELGFSPNVSIQYIR